MIEKTRVRFSKLPPWWPKITSLPYWLSTQISLKTKRMIRHPLSVLLPTVIYVHVYLLRDTNPSDEVSSVMTPGYLLDHNAYVCEATDDHASLQRPSPTSAKGLESRLVLSKRKADIVRYESQNSLLLVSSIFSNKVSKTWKCFPNKWKTTLYAWLMKMLMPIIGYCNVGNRTQL